MRKRKSFTTMRGIGEAVRVVDLHVTDCREYSVLLWSTMEDRTMVQFFV